jgi:hypothetical protein
MNTLTAIELLRPYIQYQLGDEVPDPEARLLEYRRAVPGRLPNDYIATLLSLRRATGIHFNQILSLGTPPPRARGMFECIGSNPPIHILYGLQSSNNNVFGGLAVAEAQCMPSNLVPIGADLMDNQICIDVSEAGNGRIYHCFLHGDAGPDDADGRPGWGNIFLLAESFTDMCRRLRPAELLPDDAPVGRICWVRP